jgi:transposase InsO family protein
VRSALWFGELIKLGIEVSERTVSRLIARVPKPPSQTWRTFLANHMSVFGSVDFFVVYTITFELLYVFVILEHERRRVVHFGVTAHPSAEWTANHMVQAFPFETAPRYTIRDRDKIYGAFFRRRVAQLGIEQVVTARKSPWQNPFVERMIGSIRRECLNHVIIMDERHLRRILRSYLAYYHETRTHLALCKDAPTPRAVQGTDMGDVIAIPQVGGLHHRYERRAA